MYFHSTFVQCFDINEVTVQLTSGVSLLLKAELQCNPTVITDAHTTVLQLLYRWTC